MRKVTSRHKGLLLTAIMIIASIALIYTQSINWETSAETDEFYFGASFGGQTVQEAKTQIDKVKNFTNFFVINSYDLSTNETALNEVCDYAAQANLNFIVYFDFISRIAYPWHQTWLDTAKERWEGKFLGIYLRDEPGGHQIDEQDPIKNATGYSDAANQFVNNILLSNSMIDAKNKTISTFTSDYALYWWDYLAGYDTVFVELGWKLNSTQQIALCRGAANMQGKDWGAIITWTDYEPPYLGTPKEIYGEMTLAYRAGAKYVVVFNYPTYPEGNLYGTLSEGHLKAMEQFWKDTKTHPRKNNEKTSSEVVLVLPKDYGWGMRRNDYISQDNIWGLWPEDEKTPLILEKTTTLLNMYGLKVDIIFEDANFYFEDKYSQVHFWNTTVHP